MFSIACLVSSLLVFRSTSSPPCLRVFVYMCLVWHTLVARLSKVCSLVSACSILVSYSFPLQCCIFVESCLLFLLSLYFIFHFFAGFISSSALLFYCAFLWHNLALRLGTRFCMSLHSKTKTMLEPVGRICVHF